MARAFSISLVSLPISPTSITMARTFLAVIALCASAAAFAPAAKPAQQLRAATSLSVSRFQKGTSSAPPSPAVAPIRAHAHPACHAPPGPPATSPPRPRDPHEPAPTPPPRARPSRRAPQAYVPPGFTAAEWAAKQRQEKQAKVDNKKKYPKGAPNVLGVGQYLLDLASDQTFKQEKVGERSKNTKINKTGHRFAKVKFGEFTKEAYDEWKAKGN